MIIRTWRGRASPSHAQKYVEHFAANVLPELRTIEGFRGASLPRVERSGEIEFLVLTKWASLGAIRAFADADISRAIVEPEAQAALTSYDPAVTHYDVVLDSRE